MFTQKKSATGATTSSQKLHSIHVLPNGRGFAGRIEVGKATYHFTFIPKTATSVNGKMVLTGSVKVKAPAGQPRAVDNVTATLLATQGSITNPPPMPAQLPAELKPTRQTTRDSLPITDSTGRLASVGVMYLKLSPLDGRALGVPMDLGLVQLNVRMYPASEIERDLHWLYSALVEAMQGEHPSEQRAAGCLSEINRILRA